jgi:hypothetical protein
VLKHHRFQLHPLDLLGRTIGQGLAQVGADAHPGEEAFFALHHIGEYGQLGPLQGAEGVGAVGRYGKQTYADIEAGHQSLPLNLGVAALAGALAATAGRVGACRRNPQNLLYEKHGSTIWHSDPLSGCRLP